jgi:hypothetical protein
MGFDEWMKESTKKDKEKALIFLHLISENNFKRKERGEEELSHEEKEKFLEEMVPGDKKDFFSRFLNIDENTIKKQIRILRESLN